jgi:hypothetical protein
MSISTLWGQQPLSTRLGAFTRRLSRRRHQAPFWPVWLAGRGLDAPEIALLFRRRDLGQGCPQHR